MFRVNQKVVCVRGKPGVINKGSTWTVLAINDPCGCALCLDVGIVFFGVHPRTQCTGCGGIYPSDGIWWLSVDRFAPLEEKSETMYEDIMQKIDVELPLIENPHQLN